MLDLRHIYKEAILIFGAIQAALGFNVGKKC